MKAPQGLDYLDNASCMEAYSVDFLTGRRNLLLVTNSNTAVYPNGTRDTEDTVFRMLDSISWNSRLNSEYNWNTDYWWCREGTEAWQYIVRINGNGGCSLSEAIANAAALEDYTAADVEDEYKYSESWTIEY